MGTIFATMDNHIQDQVNTLTRTRKPPAKSQNAVAPASRAISGNSVDCATITVENPDRIPHANIPSTTDAQLLSFVASGEREALETLYDRHVKACNSVALKMVADPFLAEEIVQDVFLKLWVAPHSYEPGRGKFSVWLLTLVHHRSIDRLRQIKRSKTTNSVAFDSEEIDLVDVLPDGASNLYEEVWRQERVRTVRKALNLLPTTQREVIGLAYLGGLTQREIAVRLGVPVGTIKTRTRRGLRQLRRLLSGADLLEDVA